MSRRPQGISVLSPIVNSVGVADPPLVRSVRRELAVEKVGGDRERGITRRRADEPLAGAPAAPPPASTGRPVSGPRVRHGPRGVAMKPGTSIALMTGVERCPNQHHEPAIPPLPRRPERELSLRAVERLAINRDELAHRLRASWPTGKGCCAATWPKDARCSGRC